MPTALEKADALFAKSDEALRRGRPNSSPADSRRKSMERKARRKKWTSPGPGAYNVDDSKLSAVTGTREMCMGRHGKGGPSYSFGTASRDDDGSKVYLGSGHNKASSMFGHQSPGPATYNTRSNDSAPGFKFTKDSDRSMSRGAACSPGPCYNLVNNEFTGRGTTLGGRRGFVMGKAGEKNGHQPINNPNLASPGPKYNLVNNPHAGKGTTVGGKQGYTFRGGKLRGTEKIQFDQKPGPGAHNVPDSCGPGTGAPEFGFGTGVRPPLNNNKDARNTPAPNAYALTSASRSGVTPNVGVLASKNVVVQQGKGQQTADRFAEARNAFATAGPGPGTYMTENHKSIGGVTGESAPAYSMAALNGFQARADASKSPGPKYDTRRELGDMGPYVSFTREDRGNLKNLTGGFGQSPGPVTALQGDPINPMTGKTMAPGWGPNPDKQFITKGHQSAQAVIDTPAGQLLHGADDSTHHKAPAFSWVRSRADHRP